VIKVYNKSDLYPDFYPHDGVLISALNKDLETLKQAIANTLGLQPIHFASPSLYQARHLNQLRRIKQHLTQALLDAEQKVSMDILSSSLQLAYDETVVLLGLDGKINLHDEIFSRFCVGK
jgi:tRNA U34 5-carboxymethylaminomethyl modifying GTPase MnmE/TrmE